MVQELVRKSRAISLNSTKYYTDLDLNYGSRRQSFDWRYVLETVILRCTNRLDMKCERKRN